MNLERVAVVGLGSLGSFVANEIAPHVGELVLVDYDKVEKRNLLKSVYDDEDIGEYKTDALERVVHPKCKNITQINKQFREGKTKLPECSLVVDCRDFLYNRKSIIDVRLYITSRYFVLDFRKNVKYDYHTEGTYDTKVTKEDFRLSAICFRDFMVGERFALILSCNRTHFIDLDNLSPNKNPEPLPQRKPPEEVIYTPYPGCHKISNLSTHLKTIYRKNKNKSVAVYLGGQDSPFATKVVGKGQFSHLDDVTELLTFMTNLKCTAHPGYLIQTKEEGLRLNVELLPETGGA